MNWQLKNYVHFVRIAAYMCCISPRNDYWQEVRIVYGPLTCSQFIKINCANSIYASIGAQPTVIEYWIVTRLTGSDEISVLIIMVHVSCAEIKFKHHLQLKEIDFSILDRDFR